MTNARATGTASARVDVQVNGRGRRVAIRQLSPVTWFLFAAALAACLAGAGAAVVALGGVAGFATAGVILVVAVAGLLTVSRRRTTIIDVDSSGFSLTRWPHRTISASGRLVDLEIASQNFSVADLNMVQVTLDDRVLVQLYPATDAEVAALRQALAPSSRTANRSTQRV